MALIITGENIGVYIVGIMNFILHMATRNQDSNVKGPRMILSGIDDGR